MSLGEEVVILFAGTKGFLDKISRGQTQELRAQVLDYVKGKYPGSSGDRRNKQIISRKLEKKMKEVLTEFDTYSSPARGCGIFVHETLRRRNRPWPR